MYLPKQKPFIIIKPIIPPLDSRKELWIYVRSDTQVKTNIELETTMRCGTFKLIPKKCEKSCDDGCWKLQTKPHHIVWCVPHKRIERTDFNLKITWQQITYKIVFLCFPVVVMMMVYLFTLNWEENEPRTTTEPQLFFPLTATQLQQYR